MTEWNNKKMVIVFYLLLTVGVGWCTNSQNFTTRTVGVGQNVTLSCIRHRHLTGERLYWIRIISRKGPEFLGGTFTFDYDDYNNTHHIIAKQGNGTFILHISKTKLSDTGLYYCVKVKQLVMTFLEGTFLKIKGPEPDITDIIQMPPSLPLHAGDPVTLQCSVLSISDSKTCPGNHSVYWFRYSESHPSLIYAHGIHGNECERSPETSSQQKCVYSFSKNVTPSDAGSYYCAVATCGQIIFGHGTKLDIEALSMWDLQKANTAVFLLCAALATSVMVISYLIYIIKKKTYDCCSDAGAANGEQQHHQGGEDSMLYSQPAIAKRKAGKVERRSEKAAARETLYTGVKT